MIWSKVFNYTDDITSDVAHGQLELVLKLLKEDAASNGLVANTTRTVFMLLNHRSKKADVPISIHESDWSRALYQTARNDGE